MTEADYFMGSMIVMGILAFILGRWSKGGTKK